MFRSLFSNALLAAACVLAVSACDKSSSKGEAPKNEASKPAEAPKAAVEISDAARTEAKEIFTNRCAACHGQTGTGDGPTAAALTPKPRNFKDAAWQKEVTDEHIEKIIKLGGAAVGKSPMMPPNPDLQTKDAVIAALREHIRGLAAN